MYMDKILFRINFLHFKNVIQELFSSTSQPHFFVNPLFWKIQIQLWYMYTYLCAQRKLLFVHGRLIVVWRE